MARRVVMLAELKLVQREDGGDLGANRGQVAPGSSPTRLNCAPDSAGKSTLSDSNKRLRPLRRVALTA